MNAYVLVSDVTAQSTIDANLILPFLPCATFQVYG